MNRKKIAGAMRKSSDGKLCNIDENAIQTMKCECKMFPPLYLILKGPVCDKFHGIKNITHTSIITQ